MSEAPSVHSAAGSAAGYLYQARLALVEALRYAYVDSSIEIAVEKFDDVSFEKGGNALELLQTKHHLKRSGELTDKSVDLWKTAPDLGRGHQGRSLATRPHALRPSHNGARSDRFCGVVSPTR